MSEPNELEVIDATLDQLLSAMIASDLQPRAEGPFALRPFSVAALDESMSAREGMTEAQRFLDDIHRNPVRLSLRRAVRIIGKRLHEIGGLDAMQDACQRVAERDERDWGRRTSIMDTAWDGIGQTDGSMGWVS